MDDMLGMGGASYAVQESWDIQQAAQALAMVAGMVCGEEDEPDDVLSLANIMRSLMEFINGEIQEMVTAAKQGEGYEKSTITLNGVKYISTQTKEPAQVKQSPLKLAYVKSLCLEKIPDMAVKYVSKDTIKGYNFLWGSEKLTDIEVEYFTRPGSDKGSNFWDDVLGKNPRPLTWDHNQDEDFKAAPVIGMVDDWGDDEVGRWYTAKLDRSHRYRKAIDALIAQGKLGTSSDSAPQYITRVKTGKATWLKDWAWFASALTDTPAEPRMIGSLEFLKSIGVFLPDMRDDKTAWLKFAKMRREALELNTR
jgi:hypothetical protein